MVNFGCQASTLTPWGSQLLSEGRIQDREHWEPLKQEQVLPAALLGGSISEQEEGGRNSPAAGLRGSVVFLTPLIGCGDAQAITKAECPKAPLLGDPGEVAEHLLTLGSAIT